MKQKEFDTLRTKLLRGAREFYRRLEGLLEGQSVEHFRLELASICDSLGLTLRDAGRAREASVRFDQARELCEALVEANPNDPKFVHELARTLGNWTTSSPDDGSKAVVTGTLGGGT